MLYRRVLDCNGCGRADVDSTHFNSDGACFDKLGMECHARNANGDETKDTQDDCSREARLSGYLLSGKCFNAAFDAQRRR